MCWMLSKSKSNSKRKMIEMTDVINSAMYGKAD
jgi:hypothetical protein